MEATVGAVQVLNRDSVHISLDSQPVDESVTINYHTLNGNQPAVNGNYFGLWPANDGMIPASPAIFSAPVRKNVPSSSYTCMMPISNDSYIIGYCQTGDPAKDAAAYTNVSASTLIYPADNVTAYIDQASLDITGNANSAIVTYKLLKNVNPASHWFGIWKENKVIGVDEAMYTNRVSNVDPGKTGKLILNDVSFSRGTRYTMAYFVSGYTKEKQDVSKMLAYIEFTF